MKKLRKLTLNKHKIAAIRHVKFILGGADNSNAATFCDVTGDVSVTCITNCNCDQTNIPPSCQVTNPGTTRPNTGLQPSATCPDLG
ncbi:MAG: hypothetical protein AAF617_18410 [Bacteroidota bacterium]